MRLHYRLDGNWAGGSDAPVLVLGHALGVSHAMWLPQCDVLSAQFRLLSYDGRGHGDSTVTPGPYTVAQLGQDVLALTEALGIRRFHFCGLSMGGLVGQWLAGHAPTRLDRLVLACTAARFGPPETFDARIGRVLAEGMQPLVEGILERWFTAPFRAAEPSQVARIRALLQACSPAGYAANCAAVRDADLRDSLARITAPTLVISGSADLGATPEQGSELAKGIAGARFVELPAAHLANVETAAAFNALLLEHLA
jgi:3-oxoadipate enol-lactonase